MWRVCRQNRGGCALKDKYRNKWLLSCDDRWTVRTEREWFDRYMIKASEMPDEFELVEEG